MINIAKPALRQWLREPLVHFLIAGALVFAFSVWRGAPADPESRTITVDADAVTRLSQGFVQTWGRAPSPAEIDGLIRAEIKEEVYYREALRLGLDADDPIVRRRMRSKMEFLAKAQVENAMPDNAALAAWFARNRNRYTEGARFDLDQLYLGEASDAEAARIMTALKSRTDWRTLAQPISLPQSVANSDEKGLARIFGAEFAAAAVTAKQADWAGPVQSGYGRHLIRVRMTAQGRTPPLADIRQRVENDWRAETAATREAKAYQLLLNSYTIYIDPQ
jgi:peptidyl-prolyl cis-trans isomerase C